MENVRIVDVVDAATFGLVPPCADPAFDHGTCDFWEDADRGAKTRRQPSRGAAPPPPPRPALTDNPFARADPSPAFNPFLTELEDRGAPDNPFLPSRTARPSPGPDAPGKLALLGRGLAVFGSYAKVLLLDEEPCAYAQFGPLSAYPRALRLRGLYPQLPTAPLPAVITCIATTSRVRGQGLAHQLIEEVCRDLAERGFAAVETYPEIAVLPDTTSMANRAFWDTAGFHMVVADERFPAFRRELE